MNEAIYLTAKQVATTLGISLPTLYAYVSRGLIRSEAGGGSRNRRYHAEDVANLQARRRHSRDGASAAGEALDFGTPVLESTITLIERGRLYYRGRDATGLAERMTLESVAALLWQAEQDPFTPDNLPPLPAVALPDDLAPTTRCLALLSLAAAADSEARASRTPPELQRAGARVMRLLAAAVVAAKPSAAPLHQVLARGWQLDEKHGADLIRAALVLIADHELNVSAFTTRCIASAGATLYGATIGGIAALQGGRHGGAAARAETFLAELASSADLRGAVGLWLQREAAARWREVVEQGQSGQRPERGEQVPGFGHALYRDGDPRARWLLDRLALHGGAEAGFALEVAQHVTEMSGQKPNVDFALAALARALRLPAGAPLAIFTVGRAAGWIGHALEQYAAGTLIRPRARYVGMAPATMTP